MTASATQKHLFYLEMAKLLEAGFDIRKAATVLADTKLPVAQQAMLKDLHSGLESGETIAAAFSKDAKSISELERAILAAGERGGKLAPAFAHLSGYFGMLAKARQRMVSGMAYPAVVLHLGVIIGTVPMDLMNGDSLGKIAGHLALALLTLYALVLVVAVFVRQLVKRAPHDPATDRLLRRIPWIGKVRQEMAMARYCKVYHSCLLAGLPMRETAQVAANASHSAEVRRAGVSVASAAAEGNPLGPHFIAEDAFPKAFARSYATGEEAGTLDTDLARWAKLFEDNAAAASETAALMVPKILYFCILIFVGWKIISFFQGYYGGMLEMMEG